MTTYRALEVRGLRKRHGATEAVAGLDLELAAGEIVGLIGPDGAGKTTTMRILVGLVAADAGEARVLGHDRPDDRSLANLVGYMPQRFSLYPDLTVAENLRFFAELYHVPRRERAAREGELYEFSRLGPFRNRRAAALSGGMKQKLALACNLVHRPRLLVLDEPTTGVDPVSRQEFWQLLRRFADEGLGILVSTPYMDEAERCDRVHLMQAGRVLVHGAPAEVTAGFPGGLLTVSVDHADRVAELLPDAAVVRFGDAIHVRHDPGAGDRMRALLADHDIDARPIPPSIEDVFVARTAAAEGTR